MAVFFLLSSCGGGDGETDTKPKGKVVAEVYGEQLTEKALEEMVDPRLEGLDKDMRRSALIENWITQQIVLHKAKTELPNADKLINEKLEKYKTSLLMYEYEKRLVQKHLDTTVSDKEISNYYKENIDDFELDDYLVRAILIKAPKDADDLDKVNFWFRSNDSTHIQEMTDWAGINADNFYYDNESWLMYDEIQKMLPQEMVLNKRYFIVNKLSRKYEGEDYVYFFRILNFRTGISPLEFEKNNIKARILQLRITKLRDKLRKEIIEDAYNNEKVLRY